jgi:phage terminase small subunit
MADEFDPETAANILGLEGRQRAMAFALMRGATQTAAALEAGYSGDPKRSTFRKSCSEKANAKKVAKFLEWAATGKSLPEKAGDLEEIRSKLWKQVRSHDLVAQGRAIEQLIKLGLIQAQEPGHESRTTKEILEEIATYSPEYAANLAGEQGLSIDMLSPDIRQKLAHAQETTAKIWILDNAAEAIAYANHFLSAQASNVVPLRPKHDPGITA